MAQVSSSERYAESIAAFDSAYEERSKRTLEVLSNFFQKLRDCEPAYHERLVAAGSDLLEKVAAEQGVEWMAEEVRAACAISPRAPHNLRASSPPSPREVAPHLRDLAAISRRCARC